MIKHPKSILIALKTSRRIIFNKIMIERNLIRKIIARFVIYISVLFIYSYDRCNGKESKTEGGSNERAHIH